MNFCSWKDRKAAAADLRLIYEAASAEKVVRHLDGFEEKWIKTQGQMASAIFEVEAPSLIDYASMYPTP